MPDYSHYLELIVQALQQRPATPPTWVIALVASVIGGLFAVAAQIGRALYDERRRRNLLLKMMHQELKKNFLTVYQAWQPLASDSVVVDPRFVGYFKEALVFFGQELLQRSPEIYILFPEHWIVETLYFSFKRISNGEPNELDNHIRNALFLYAWNLLKNEVFSNSARGAMLRPELDEVIPKAESCLAQILIPPVLMPLRFKSTP